jgi:aspartyl-tRNA(Asn)/glutamyl-tRNA(Gln) amidotransferase subunit B
VTAEAVAELQRLVDDGRLTDKLARTVLEGVVAGEGAVLVMAARGTNGLGRGALTDAVDAAITANPDVAQKVRGKVAAARVLVGAVLRATGGQADARWCASWSSPGCASRC